MQKFTQKAIKENFLILLNQKSLDKITVRELVDTCGINKNTFYYYYSDLYNLLEDIFQEEADIVLNISNQKATFYEEYIRAATISIGNQQALMHIYNSSHREILREYLEKVTSEFIERFVREAAAEYTISEEGISYIANFYSYAFTGNTLRWFRNGIQIGRAHD